MIILGYAVLVQVQKIPIWTELKILAIELFEKGHLHSI